MRHQSIDGTGMTMLKYGSASKQARLTVSNQSMRMLGLPQGT